MIRVLSGRWKLVISASMACSSTPGYKKMSVLPLQATILPYLAHTASSVRQLVVPTATTRWPAARAALMASAAAWSTQYHSVCMWWSSMLSSLTGRKVPSPTCSVTSTMFTPLARMVSSSSGVKCSPAVGAAALPSSLA